MFRQRVTVGHALTALLALGLLSPLARDPRWDSFPVSSFPMFARGDVGATLTLRHVLLVARDGSRRRAPPDLVGTPEPMLAMNVIDHAIARGDAARLCARVATHAGGDVVGVEVVTSVFDVRRYFDGDAEPAAREVHASCNVSR